MLVIIVGMLILLGIATVSFLMALHASLNVTIMVGVATAMLILSVFAIDSMD